MFFIQSRMSKYLKNLIETVCFWRIWYRMLFNIGPKHAARLRTKKIAISSYNCKHLLSFTLTVQCIYSSNYIRITYIDFVICQFPDIRIDFINPV